jgi:hypothetical protein
MFITMFHIIIYIILFQTEDEVSNSVSLRITFLRIKEINFIFNSKNIVINNFNKIDVVERKINLSKKFIPR